MTGKSNEIAKLRADLADARGKIVACVMVMDEMGARIVAIQEQFDRQTPKPHPQDCGCHYCT